MRRRILLIGCLISVVWAGPLRNPLPSSDTLLSEDFNSSWSTTSPPPGWTIIYSGSVDSSDWHRSEAEWTAPPDYAGGYARLYWDPPEIGTDDLISPVIDCSGYTGVLLTCKTNFSHYEGPYTARLEGSEDGGTTWTHIIKDYAGSSTYENEQFNLSWAAGKSQVRLRWHFDGETPNINHWSIDDVEVLGGTGYIDLEVVSINAPLEIWAGGNYVPVATVRNNGPHDTSNVPVVCKIYDSKDSLIYFSIELIPYLEWGEETVINFSTWLTPEKICEDYRMEIRFAEIWMDDDPTNDSKTRFYTSQADIQAVSIDEPPPEVWTGITLTPKATLKNNSPEGKATFNVICEIKPGSYIDTTIVSSLPHNDTTQVFFKDWESPLSACSSYTMTVIADVPCDSTPEDDSLVQGIDVKGDVGITSPVEPVDSVYVDSLYSPTVSLHNFTPGLTQSFPCSLYIEDEDANVIYTDGILIDSLSSEIDTEVSFKDWEVPSETGRVYTLTSFTNLPCDDSMLNDTCVWTVLSISGGALDAEVISINSPSSSIIQGITLKPNATVRNSGKALTNFDVLCYIQTPGELPYADTETVSNLNPEDTFQLTFEKEWTAKQGFYIVLVKTLLKGDMNPTNDSIWEIIQVKGIEEEGKQIPYTFDLSVLQPNPCIGVSRISYALPYKVNLRLTVYNASGRIVRVLVSKKEEPGYYWIVWDGLDKFGKRVPEGVYFIKMEAGGFQKTKKLILLRR